MVALSRIKTPFEWNSKGIYVGNKTRAYIRVYTVNKLGRWQAQCPASLSIVLEFERVNIDLLSIVVKQLCYEVPFIATFIILLFSTMSSQISHPPSPSSPGYFKLVLIYAVFRFICTYLYTHYT